MTEGSPWRMAIDAVFGRIRGLRVGGFGHILIGWLPRKVVDWLRPLWPGCAARRT